MNSESPNPMIGVSPQSAEALTAISEKRSTRLSSMLRALIVFFISTTSVLINHLAPLRLLMLLSYTPIPYKTT